MSAVYPITRKLLPGHELQGTSKGLQPRPLVGQEGGLLRDEMDVVKGYAEPFLLLLDHDVFRSGFLELLRDRVRSLLPGSRVSST